MIIYSQKFFILFHFLGKESQSIILRLFLFLKNFQEYIDKKVELCQNVFRLKNLLCACYRILSCRLRVACNFSFFFSFPFLFLISFSPSFRKDFRKFGKCIDKMKERCQNIYAFIYTSFFEKFLGKDLRPAQPRIFLFFRGKKEGD